jgi:hypothetical protein
MDVWSGGTKEQGWKEGEGKHVEKMGEEGNASENRCQHGKELERK